jgi:hypothetical protein
MQHAWVDEKCVLKFSLITRKETTLRTWRRWKNNIKVDFKEIGFKHVDWIHLAHIEPSAQPLFTLNEPFCYIKHGWVLDRING